MNRKLSLSSIFGTLFFLIMTLFLGLILYITADFSVPETWFFLPLFAGMFIGLLISLGNINQSINLNNQLIEQKKFNVQFRSCPDYWTKHTVVNDETKENVVMCYNHIEGTSSFVYGDMKRNSPEFDSRFTSHTLNDMRDKAVYKVTDDVPVKCDEQPTPVTDGSQPAATPQPTDTPQPAATPQPAGEDVVETFQTYSRDHPDYRRYRHTHTNIDRIVHADLANHDPTLVQPHSHVYLNSDSGSHSHGQIIIGDDDENIQIDERYKETDDNFKHWINPYDMGNDKRSMEINLTKLNSAENLCDLASPFAWVEAQAKCKNVKKYVPPSKTV